MRIIDYINLMPGQAPKRITEEDRERVKKLAEAIKKAAIEYSPTFNAVKK